jgi:hypothetical protein
MRESVAATNSSGELVLLHVPSGTYLRLDRSAQVIVRLLEEDDNVAAAAAALSARFSIPLSTAQTDVASVVDTLSGLRSSRVSRGRRPRLQGLVAVGRQWWALPVPLRAAVIKAAFVVAGIEIGLATTDVGTLARRLQVPLTADLADPPPVTEVDISALPTAEQRSYSAVEWVLDRWPFRGTCLRRSLATGFFLRRHHPILRLGLIDDGRTAHAWVEAGGMVFNSVEVTATLADPSWAADRHR